MKTNHAPVTAYFSMEIAFDSAVPVYAGGLGVLAGDSLRAAADLGIPMVAVTLLHREGYFRQTLSEAGEQVESPDRVDPEAAFEAVDARTTIELEGRKVQVRAWRYMVRGRTGATVPVLLLDTDMAENAAQDRALSRTLYGGDSGYRLAQEALLGVGGVRMLRAAGYSRVTCFHMNEGHSALLVSELLREEVQAADRPGDVESHVEAVRARCVFTTHTPIAAGHDRFDAQLAARVLPRGMTEPASKFFKDGWLDMTHTALSFSRWVNGVSRKHAEVCRRMFPGVSVEGITNGVHPETWIAAPMAELFDRVCEGWRDDAQQLRLALRAEVGEVLAARRRTKALLLERVERLTGQRLDAGVFTIGIARRATGYKRLDLILRNAARLHSIAANGGGLQLVFAGKAHPKDGTGHEVIRRINDLSRETGTQVHVTFLPGYDMDLAASVVSGVDLWLNTPIAPLEASGTSGMKAAMNGVPSLSVLDGWWCEGCIEGVTGWGIGDGREGGGDEADERDSSSLYEKLENSILPVFHGGRVEWARVCAHAIAVNGVYFTTHRMMRKYAERAYR